MPPFHLIAMTLALGIAPHAIRDVDGGVRRPFEPADKGTVLLFLTSDCPVSNAYAPEIQSVCRAYAARGIECLLLYEDVDIDAVAVRAHRDAYRYTGIPAAIDGDRRIANASLATVTPEAVLIDGTGKARYRGRIDNLYVDLGRRRPAPTIHDLRDAIDAVLEGRSVAHPHTEAFGCYITPSPRRSKEAK